MAFLSFHGLATLPWGPERESSPKIQVLKGPGVKKVGSGKVTSYMVAEAAGVSRTTVSFVLNDKPGANISDETRERVLETAKRLNYVPDVRARNLATGSSKTIALAVHQPSEIAFSDTYLSSVLSGLVRKAKDAGFRITIEITESDSEITELAKLLRGGAVDGLIATGWRDEVLFDGAGLTPEDPILFLSEWPLDRYSHISIDLIGAQREIVRAALDLGHRRFGCIPYVARDQSVSQERRLLDFQRQLDKAGATLVADGLHEGDLTIEGGKRAARRILQAKDAPTVIFGMNDTMAIGAVKALQDAGYCVPGDFSVIGFEGQLAADLIEPPISTVRIPWVDVGEQGAELLLDRLQNQTHRVQKLSVGSELLMRRSLAAI